MTREPGSVTLPNLPTWQDRITSPTLGHEPTTRQSIDFVAALEREVPEHNKCEYNQYSAGAADLE